MQRRISQTRFREFQGRDSQQIFVAESVLFDDYSEGWIQAALISPQAKGGLSSEIQPGMVFKSFWTESWETNNDTGHEDPMDISKSSETPNDTSDGDADSIELSKEITMVTLYALQRSVPNLLSDHDFDLRNGEMTFFDLLK
ncbi:hypothetical protein G7Y89_g3705 [Cudoniella acicularis]|uniref:Uncharacterized protein n=1 Tax=Cudoniella acicularis TaxID=354080 RepID=A0A8H4W850_9HELO|nr:hypothetical protein G7Y89_g3705 [Cudoniella acicularis]